MPLYEYECEACGHRFERIQKFSDAPIDVCPSCGGPVHKMVSSPAFHLKGSGWYATDYGKKDTGSAGKNESGSSGGSKDSKDSKESSSKDSKDTGASSSSSSDGASKESSSKDSSSAASASKTQT